jgi:hypothetical protein
MQGDASGEKPSADSVRIVALLRGATLWGRRRAVAVGCYAGVWEEW